jgi:hypothetical protein
MTRSAARIGLRDREPSDLSVTSWRGGSRPGSRGPPGPPGRSGGPSGPQRLDIDGSACPGRAGPRHDGLPSAVLFGACMVLPYLGPARPDTAVLAIPEHGCPEKPLRTFRGML